MNWGKLALAIPQLLFTFIPAVERLKGAGNGADKKSAVLELVAASAGVIDTVAPAVLQQPKVVAALGTANDAIVALKNAIADAQPSAPK